ncbi:MAG: MFS transporter [Alphaproteobacteria bacterium]
MNSDSLGRVAFALFALSLGIPIAWLADRRNRAWIITVAFGLWSAFTAACGLATNFLQLFLTRIGVGVGEAGGVAPSYSLIANFFPRVNEPAPPPPSRPPSPSAARSASFSAAFS